MKEPERHHAPGSHDTAPAGRLWDMVVLAGSLGMTLFVSIVVGVFAGHFVDTWAGTSPWGTICLALLGAVTGFWSLFKRVVALNEPSGKTGKDGTRK